MFLFKKSPVRANFQSKENSPTKYISFFIAFHSFLVFFNVIAILSKHSTISFFCVSHGSNCILQAEYSLGFTWCGMSASKVRYFSSAAVFSFSGVFFPSLNSRLIYKRINFSFSVTESPNKIAIRTSFIPSMS